MKQAVFEIASNRAIAPGVFELAMTGDTSGIAAPGQFVDLRLDGAFLRRPLSVCDWTEGGWLLLIYKVVGRGTAALAEAPVGTSLDLLTGLGNGYDLTSSGDAPLLVGGGVGAPPLYALAKRLLAGGKRPRAVLGFNTAGEVILSDAFEALGVPVVLCTADGSAGERGFVTAGMEKCGGYTHVYACGPEPMLRAVWNTAEADGQYSFEARMGCGFGACMGCSRKTPEGYLRICRDGPVLRRDEILWD